MIGAYGVRTPTATKGTGLSGLKIFLTRATTLITLLDISIRGTNMSYLCTRIHYIWSTANRTPSILPEWQSRLHGYIRGILENLKSKPLVIGGVADHIHIYCSLPSTISIADLASAIKSNSSGFIHDNFDRSFAWQNGYAGFTMSKSADDDVIRYILNQEEHHRRKSFQEELIAFFEKFQIPYDPKYVFA
jgi:putative transposase